MRWLEKILYIAVRGSAIFLPGLVAMGIYFGGLFTYLGFAVVFGFYFFVELVLWAFGMGVNLSADNEFALLDPDRPDLMEKWGVHIYAVLHLLVFPLSILFMAMNPMTTAETLGSILSLGVMAGSVGGLAGHEFIHRRPGLEKFLGIGVYGSVSYAHFSVSHLYGHHRNVGQFEDWSTSRKNESSYHFFLRAFGHGYLSAWRFAPKFMWVNTAVVAGMWGLILYLGGWRGLLIYLLTSLLATTLMEMVNYLSHYGLTRARLPNGRFEATQNKHSWESNNKVTNWFIFNAGKHCHHHVDPMATHAQLKLSHEDQYTPFGLPLMTLIAFVPPLYFWLMNKRLELISSKKERADRVAAFRFAEKITI